MIIPIVLLLLTMIVAAIIEHCRHIFLLNLHNVRSLGGLYPFSDHEILAQRLSTCSGYASSKCKAWVLILKPVSCNCSAPWFQLLWHGFLTCSLEHKTVLGSLLAHCSHWSGGLLFAGNQIRHEENDNETGHRSYPIGAYTSALFLSLTGDFGHGFW